MLKTQGASYTGLLSSQVCDLSKVGVTSLSSISQMPSSKTIKVIYHSIPYSYSTIIEWRKILANLANWLSLIHQCFTYVPIFSLPIIYSIGAYFDIFVLELLSTLAPLFLSYMIDVIPSYQMNSNIPGYLLLHTWLNLVVSFKCIKKNYY